MTTRTLVNTRPVARLGLIALLTLGLAGCASRPYQKAEVASNALTTAAGEVDTARAEIAETISTLGTLVTPSSQTPEAPGAALGRFRGALNRLERTSGQLDQRAQAMEAQGQEYFKTWDTQLARIQNPDMRASSEARQRELSGSYAALQQQYQAARRDLTPLMSDLRDLQTMLGTDLTPAGVAQAREFLPRVQNAASTASASLDRLAGEFRSLSTQLSAVPAATPRPAGS